MDKRKKFSIQSPKNLSVRYSFHIFMDNDIRLFYSDAMTKFSKAEELRQGTNHFSEEFFKSVNYKEAIREIRNCKSAWRTYENTLLNTSPTFGVVNLVKLDGLQSKLIQEARYSGTCDTRTMPVITPTLFMDTIIIA